MEMDSNASHWGDKQQTMHSSEHDEQQTTKICISTVKKWLKWNKVFLNSFWPENNALPPKNFQPPLNVFCSDKAKYLSSVERMTLQNFYSV